MIRPTKFTIVCKECGCNRVEVQVFLGDYRTYDVDFECPGCREEERVEC